MTGIPLSEDHREILKRRFQINKLTSNEVAFIMSCNPRTITRRRREFEATGQLKGFVPTTKNAEKFKPEHLEACYPRILGLQECSLTRHDISRQMLQEWLKKNPNALVKEMQQFIEADCGLKVSCETISTHLRRNLGHPPRAKAWERRKAGNV